MIRKLLYEPPKTLVFETETLAPLATSGVHEGFIFDGDDDEEGLI